MAPRKKRANLETDVGDAATEVEWVKAELLPMLRRVGFSMVSSQHGPQELGRDVVLTDLDRLGIVRYWGIQAKRGDIGVGRSREELLAQLRMAYDAPVTDGASGTRAKVSGVYLIASGKVSPTARERLTTDLGQWLHVVDGDRLATLRAALEAQDTAGQAWRAVLGTGNDREALLRERADAIVRRAYEMGRDDHSAGSVIRGYPVALADALDVDAAHRLQGDDRIEGIDVADGHAIVHVVRAGVPRYLARPERSRGWTPF